MCPTQQGQAGLRVTWPRVMTTLGIESVLMAPISRERRDRRSHKHSYYINPSCSLHAPRHLCTARAKGTWSTHLKNLCDSRTKAITSEGHVCKFGFSVWVGSSPATSNFSLAVIFCETDDHNNGFCEKYLMNDNAKWFPNNHKSKPQTVNSSIN